MLNITLRYLMNLGSDGKKLFAAHSYSLPAALTFTYDKFCKLLVFVFQLAQCLLWAFYH